MTPPAPWIGSPMKAATFSGSGLDDGVLDRLRRAQPEIVIALAGQRQLVGVGHHDMDDVGHRAAELCVHAGHAAERSAGHRRAVIGHVARDDAVLLRLAFERPVVAHQAQRRIVGLRAGRAEEHLVHVGRRDLGDLLGEQHRRRRRAAEEGIVVGQFLHLRGGGFGELVAAVADVDAPQAGHAVEDLVVLGIVDERAVGARDDARAGVAQFLVVGERMQVMRGVDLLKLLQRIVLVSHGVGPSV